MPHILSKKVRKTAFQFLILEDCGQICKAYTVVLWINVIETINKQDMTSRTWYNTLRWSSSVQNNTRSNLFLVSKH